MYILSFQALKCYIVNADVHQIMALDLNGHGTRLHRVLGLGDFETVIG